MNQLARLVVLASGFGSNLQAVLDACDQEQLDAKVVAVISDQKKAFALERARRQGIPAEYVPWRSYALAGKTRQMYDADLANIISGYQPDLIVLAGWMRLLSMSFLSHFPDQVVNLHPALPGMFPGTNAIRRAWNAFQEGKIDCTGVMVHFVPDEGVDNGPVILKAEVPLISRDTLQTLEGKIHCLEHRLLVEAISSLLSYKSLTSFQE